MNTEMTKTLNLYILVDRSFSMLSHWKETIGTLNEYMGGLKQAGANLKINLAFFDKNQQSYYQPLTAGILGKYATNAGPILQHRYTDVTEWAALSPDDLTIAPRGGTPLYDAICEFGALPKTKGLKKTDLVQFIILTDGDENVSVKHTLNDAKELLTKYAKKNWPVIYLGANVEAFKGGAKIVSSNETLASYNPHKWTETATSLTGSSMRYMASNSAQAANFLDTERTNIK